MQFVWEASMEDSSKVSKTYHAPSNFHSIEECVGSKHVWRSFSHRCFANPNCPEIHWAVYRRRTNQVRQKDIQYYRRNNTKRSRSKKFVLPEDLPHWCRCTEEEIRSSRVGYGLREQDIRCGVSVSSPIGPERPSMRRAQGPKKRERSCGTTW